MTFHVPTDQVIPVFRQVDPSKTLTLPSGARDHSEATASMLLWRKLTRTPSFPGTGTAGMSTAIWTLTIPVAGSARLRRAPDVPWKKAAPSPSNAPVLTTFATPPDACHGPDQPGSPPPWPLSGVLL